MRDEYYDRMAQTRGYADAISLIKAEYEVNHKSMREVADMLGISHQTLSTMMNRIGIPVRVAKPVPKMIPKDIKSLSISELASKYGVSKASAWRKKREYSLKGKAKKPTAPSPSSPKVGL